MNKEQYEQLRERVVVEKPRIAAKSDTTQTLLYGYTCDRETFHVYQHEGQLHRVIFTGVSEKKVIDHISGPDLAVEDIVPNKRLYPERCDFEFSKKVAQILATSDEALPFTTWDESRPALESYEDGKLVEFADLPEIDETSAALKL